MKLFEIFDKPEVIDIDHRPMSGGEQIFITMSNHDIIMVGFHALDYQRMENAFDIELDPNANIVEVNFSRNGETRLSGEGNAFSIFGVILDQIQKYIRQHNVTHLFFTSDFKEVSRVKLYRRMLARLDPNFLEQHISREIYFLASIQ